MPTIEDIKTRRDELQKYGEESMPCSAQESALEEAKMFTFLLDCLYEYEEDGPPLEGYITKGSVHLRGRERDIEYVKGLEAEVERLREALEDIEDAADMEPRIDWVVEKARHALEGRQ